MASPESHTSRLSFYGRLADHLTRQPLSMQDVSVSLEGDRRQALLKRDGYFAFTELSSKRSKVRCRCLLQIERAGEGDERRVVPFRDKAGETKNFIQQSLDDAHQNAIYNGYADFFVSSQGPGQPDLSAAVRPACKGELNLKDNNAHSVKKVMTNP